VPRLKRKSDRSFLETAQAGMKDRIRQLRQIQAARQGEELNLTFMFDRRLACAKRAEIAAFARARIDFARIEPILPGFQFANHGGPPFWSWRP
jgi:hypothetical protein